MADEERESRVVTVGRIVHYQIAEQIFRPAVVVRVYEDNIVNLQVFLDGLNDKEAIVNFRIDEIHRGMSWKTSVHEGSHIGEWKWPYA